MRRMLLLGCAVALAGAVAVVALGADEPASLERRGPDVSSRVAALPESGPFALAASQAQADANAERHRAARAAYDSTRTAGEDDDGYDGGRYRRPGRTELLAGIADRLGVSDRAMWRAVASVRRQISPRGFSDARDEAVAIMASELHRRPAAVADAVQAELGDRDGDRGRR